MKIVISICLVLFLFTACGHRSEIPVFNLLLPDKNKVFNTSKIPLGKITMLVFFSTGCEHCQDETIDLIKHMDKVQNIQFYYVGIDSLHRIKEFREFYGLDKYNNIMVGRDETFTFHQVLGLNTIPSAVIYDRQGRLRVVIKGSFTVDEIAEKTKTL